MPATTTRAVSVEPKRAPGENQGSAMNWLARHLRRQATRPGKDDDRLLGQPPKISVDRPQTAPSADRARKPSLEALRPPPTLGQLPTRPRNKPPPRPPRPDSGVIRDVNAWLDASMIKPAPQLMDGIPYWREGPHTGSGTSTDVRYAVPIVRAPEVERSTTTQSRNLKTFCRRAKRMQVRMPTLLRTTSQRLSVQRRKQNNRRSTSMPLLLAPSVSAPMNARPLARSRSLMHMICRTPTNASAQGVGCIGTDPTAPRRSLGQSPRLGTPRMRFDNQESSMERRVNAVFGQTARLGGGIRPPTHSQGTQREDSMGNLSDAPTYSSGPPPPSYRSRAASIRTTSSFGCVDGMSLAQRQASQQRAAQRNRGVKGKIKKLAQKAHFTK